LEIIHGLAKRPEQRKTYVSRFKGHDPFSESLTTFLSGKTTGFPKEPRAERVVLNTSIRCHTLQHCTSIATYNNPRKRKPEIIIGAIT
jgi:hypothetical protein